MEARFRRSSRSSCAPRCAAGRYVDEQEVVRDALRQMRALVQGRRRSERGRSRARRDRPREPGAERCRWRCCRAPIARQSLFGDGASATRRRSRTPRSTRCARCPGAREVDRLFRGPVEQVTAAAQMGETQAQAMRQNLEATRQGARHADGGARTGEQRRRVSDRAEGRQAVTEHEVIVEIPRGSKNKYEMDHDSGAIWLDRTLFTSMQYPADYGFFPHTLADDGDPLDALVLLAGADVRRLPRHGARGRRVLDVRRKGRRRQGAVRPRARSALASTCATSTTSTSTCLHEDRALLRVLQDDRARQGRRRRVAGKARTQPKPRSPRPRLRTGHDGARTERRRSRRAGAPDRHAGVPARARASRRRSCTRSATRRLDRTRGVRRAAARPLPVFTQARRALPQRLLRSRRAGPARHAAPTSSSCPADFRRFVDARRAVHAAGHDDDRGRAPDADGVHEPVVARGRDRRRAAPGRGRPRPDRASSKRARSCRGRSASRRSSRTRCTSTRSTSSCERPRAVRARRRRRRPTSSARSPNVRARTSPTAARCRPASAASRRPSSRCSPSEPAATTASTPRCSRPA